MVRVELTPLLVLVACGGRTSLGAGEAGVTDGAAPDAATGVQCAWSLSGPPVRVSNDPIEVPGDVGLEDAVETIGGALVTWVTPGDLMHPQTAVAKLVAFDVVSNGNEHVVLRAPSVTSPLSDVSLGNGFGHVAITAWDGRSCVLRPTTVDGASNGSLAEIDPRRCGGMVATPSGFDLLLYTAQMGASPQLHLARVSPFGTVTPPDALLFEGGPDHGVGAADRVTLDDGTFIAAAVIARVGPNGMNGVVARHFDAQGAPLAPYQTLSTNPSIVPTMLSIARASSGAAIAFVVFDGQKGQLHVAPVDRDARLARAPVVAWSSPVSVTSIDLSADVTGGLLVAWSEYGPNPSSASVRSLSATAEPRGVPIAVPDPVSGAKYQPAIRVVATGKKGLVVFGARSETTPHRIYAAPLACAP